MSQSPEQKSPNPGPLVYVSVWAIMIALVAAEVVVRLYLPAGNSAITLYIFIFVIAGAALSALFHLHLRYESRLFSALLLIGLMMVAILLLASLFGG